MSMMGELKFFLGLQIRQQCNGIFIFKEKYLKDVMRKFGMQDCKGVKILCPQMAIYALMKMVLTPITMYTAP